MYKWILFSVLLYGCGPSREDSIAGYNHSEIVYTFPLSVTQLLASKIKENSDTLFFELSRDSDFFTIELHQANKNFPNYRWLSCSNRKVKIGNSFFPLLISYDYSYGVIETPAEILARARENKYFPYTKIYNPGEPYYIKFDNNGHVTYAGR
ncbi:hypothetical protein Q4E93_21990 [Flavitalea sp. BT771]|uniref:hypothetical protein n=1 Tax=Flavitalea sp. BT771 TaxID=3063329 RepID=UPI0026E1DF9C|nr:hypothetical protein [Flavitalea sp. BT771]MDO6433298.1 hypothetical protein [Flavitalea sp. BT771]MDV6222797.1 hypothetical protein [Flavitalea sp. BT771]